MDLRLSPTSLPAAIRPGATQPLANGKVGGSQGEGFSVALKSALQSVSETQNHTARLQREVQMESTKVSLEETMVSMQKAQIGFQSALHVRNRMVQAYTDIMNMQV